MLKPSAACVALSLFAVSCALPLHNGETTDPNGSPIATSVCAILKNPTKFDGRRIDTQGIAVTDYREFSGIEDPACSKTYLPFGGSKRPIAGEMEFESALQKVRPAKDKAVAFRVIGLVRAHPGGNPSVTLATENVYDVRIVSK